MLSERWFIKKMNKTHHCTGRFLAFIQLKCKKKTHKKKQHFFQSIINFPQKSFLNWFFPQQSYKKDIQRLKVVHSMTWTRVETTAGLSTNPYTPTMHWSYRNWVTHTRYIGQTHIHLPLDPIQRKKEYRTTNSTPHNLCFTISKFNPKILSVIYIYIYIYFFFFHHTCESTCDTVLISRQPGVITQSQGGTATPGTTKQLLPLDRVLRELYIDIYICQIN